MPASHGFSKKEKSGDVLISPRVTPQVSSALRSLTTVFGMGTGGSSSLLSPQVAESAACTLYPQN